MMQREHADAVKILLADDSASWRAALRRALAKLGYTDVTECIDGSEALERLRREPGFGLVISDWNMDPMDGLEFLKAVRADSGLKHLPFILVTAEPGSGIRTWAAEAGVSYFMQKPFDAAALGAAITGALGKA